VPRSAARCPACGGPLSPWRRATAADPELAGRDSYELARCGPCGSAVTLDPPSSERAGALYEGGTYVPSAPAAGWLLEPLRRLVDADRMRFLGDLPAGVRVLEIGAGDGRFVARMRAAGLDAHGVEPSPSARERARAGGIELAADPPGDGERADAIVLWHVLEHLPDPAASLESARRALAPSGRLIVAVPNLASLQARIGGDRWFHQDVPRHLTHLTPGGLTVLLERSGFGRPRVTHLLVEQNPLGMWQTLLNRVTSERNVAFRLLKRDFSMRGGRAKLDVALTIALALPLALVAPLLELGAGLARRGGTIVAVATPAGAGVRR
jgi:SAM-dependent methyltransferase